MSVQYIELGLTKELYIIVTAYMTYIMVGISRSYSTFLIPQLRLPSSTIRISDDEEYTIENLDSYIIPIGCILGGLITDILGRKSLLLCTLLSCIIGWFLICIANCIEIIYSGIVLNAVAAGMAFCIVVYIAEICMSDSRSIMMNLKEPAFAIGIICNNILIKKSGWRTSAYCFLTMSVIFLIMQCFLPESPNWLIVKTKNIDKATAILNSIRYSRSEAEKEILDIRTHYTKPAADRLSVERIWTNLLSCWKQFAIMFGLIILQQTSGITILTGCTVILYDELRIPFKEHMDFIHCTACFISSFIPFLSSLYLGRKNCITVSALGMTAATSVMAVYELHYQHWDNKPYFWIILTGIYCYYCFALVGVMIYPSLMPSEIFPSHSVGLACGICGFVIYTIILVIRYFYFYYFLQTGLITLLWLLTVCSFLSIPYSRYIVPETQDKTLNQIQTEYFNKR